MAAFFFAAENGRSREFRGGFTELPVITPMCSFSLNHRGRGHRDPQSLYVSLPLASLPLAFVRLCAFVPPWFKNTHNKVRTERIVPAPKLALCGGCSPGLIRPSATFPKGEGKWSAKLILEGVTGRPGAVYLPPWNLKFAM
jgi:hypothetical protein